MSLHLFWKEEEKSSRKDFWIWRLCLESQSCCLKNCSREQDFLLPLLVQSHTVSQFHFDSQSLLLLCCSFCYALSLSLDERCSLWFCPFVFTALLSRELGCEFWCCKTRRTRRKTSFLPFFLLLLLGKDGNFLFIFILFLVVLCHLHLVSFTHECNGNEGKRDEGGSGQGKSIVRTTKRRRSRRNEQKLKGHGMKKQKKNARQDLEKKKTCRSKKRQVLEENCWVERHSSSIMKRTEELEAEDETQWRLKRDKHWETTVTSLMKKTLEGGDDDE